MFFDTFSRLCNEKHKSPNAVAKELGIPSGSITNWKNGTNPRHGTLLKIADYFDVSVDYLLGNTDKKEKSPAVEYDSEADRAEAELNEYLEFLRTDENYRMMFSLMKGATKADVEKAVKIVKSLLGED